MTDILDLIDNATEHRCACGCNTQLPEGGPSAWFASQECQGRWNESHATDPGAVLDREDPFIDYDAAWWTPEWSAADAAAYERINGLRDVSGTITGYWDPPPVNINPIMDDIIRWLAANRIDYRSVPIEAVPAIFDNRIFCPVYVRSQAGKLWVDRRSDSVRTRMVRARLRVPPPPVLGPWLASGSLLPVLVWAKRRLARHRMHTSYSSRLRSRRRRNRR